MCYTNSGPHGRQEYDQVENSKRRCDSAGRKGPEVFMEEMSCDTRYRVTVLSCWKGNVIPPLKSQEEDESRLRNEGVNRAG